MTPFIIKTYIMSYVRQSEMRESYSLERSLARKEKKLARLLIKRKKRGERLKLNQQKLRNPNEVAFIGLLMEIEADFVWQQPFYDKERCVCVDFYFPEQNIVIEIDGRIHLDQIEYDKARTKYLKKVHKIDRVLRYTNAQLATSYAKVLESVDYELCK